MGERVGQELREREAERAPVTPQVRERSGPAQMLALQRNIGNRATRALLRQVPQAPPQPAQQAGQQVQPRQDYVFIVGADPPRTTGFYTVALRYWRAHAPNARFVTDLRDLASLLGWINANVTQPMGNVYIVSHANEDGTLSFGLDPADRRAARGPQVPGRDGHLTVRELRAALHPAGGAASSLPTLNAGLVDDNTSINIKGCDIGRTQGMVELIDEAFGGPGTVTAPTHEQVYGYDTVLGDRAVAAARAEVEARHPEPPPPPPQPPPVASSLRGAERRQAVRERTRLVQERNRAIQERRRLMRARQRAINAELATIREVGQTYEALSGPMFQRTGTTRLTLAEIRAEVDRLYGHLSEQQRAALAQRLSAADPRRARVAQQQGTFHHQGQRVYTYRPFTFRHWEPQNLAHVNAKHGRSFAQRAFVAQSMNASRVPAAGGGFTIHVVVDGVIRRRGQPDQPSQQTIDTQGAIPEDAEILTRGRAQLNNPDRYAWRVDTVTAANGDTTRTAVAERVVVYLHHGSLDADPHTPFTRPLTDPDFYATSTYAPPPPPPPPQPPAQGGGGP